MLNRHRRCVLVLLSCAACGHHGGHQEGTSGEAGTSSGTSKGDGEASTGEASTGQAEETPTTLEGCTESSSSGDGSEDGSSSSGGEQPGCGDGIVQAWEECDGEDLAGTTCFSLGLQWGGTPTCANDCTYVKEHGCYAWDTTAMIGTWVSYIVSAGRDPLGSAHLLWEDTADDTVWGARFDTSAGTWQPAAALGEFEQLAPPSVASDPLGNAMVVWISPGQAVSARYYDVGLAAWLAPQLIDAPLTGASELSMDMDDNGVAIALWRESGGTRELWSARFDPIALTWSAPVSVDPGTHDYLAIIERIAVDAAGNAFVSWRHESAGPCGNLDFLACQHDRRVVQYDVATDVWLSPVVLEAAATGPGASDLAVDRGSGDAFVAYAFEAAAPELRVARYAAAADVWQPAVVLDTGGAKQGVSVVAGADAAVVTSLDDATNHLIGATYAGGAWSAAQQLDTGSIGLQDLASVDSLVDDQGNAIVHWLQNCFESPCNAQLWAIRWDVGAAAWSDTVVLDTASEPPVYTPAYAGLDMTMHADGRANLGWAEADALGAPGAYARWLH